MTFKKGISGNPKGRPRAGNSIIEQLKAAIKQVEKEKGKLFLVHLAEQAYIDNTVLVALSKKILPDLSAQKVESTTTETRQLVLIRNNDTRKVIDTTAKTVELPSTAVVDAEQEKHDESDIS